MIGRLARTLACAVVVCVLGLGIARAIQSGSATVALDGTLDLGGLYKKPLHLEQRLTR